MISYTKQISYCFLYSRRVHIIQLSRLALYRLSTMTAATGVWSPLTGRSGAIRWSVQRAAIVICVTCQLNSLRVGGLPLWKVTLERGRPRRAPAPNEKI